jgi:hypothetical protein
MLLVQKVVTSVTASDPIKLNLWGSHEVSLQVVISGTATYTVQQTLDDPASSPTWFSHPDSALVGATTNQQGNYGYLPRAVRINVTAVSGSVTFTVLQPGC